MMDTRERVVTLFQQGLTYGQIRYATGLSRGTIGGHLARWRRENDLEATKVVGRLWTDGEDNDLRRMFFAGATTEAIAKTLGRTDHAITTRIWVLRRDDKLQPRKPSDDCPADKAYALKMREADAKFIRALAEAFSRGDHLSQMARAA